MKVDHNITIYAGVQPESSAERNGAAKRKTVFAGDLRSHKEGALKDRIAEKKAKAQEKAMKAVGDAFAGELKVDEGMEESRQHVKALWQEQKELKKGLEDIDRREETLETARANKEISEEEYNREMKDIKQEQMVQEQKLARNEGQIMGENASIRGTRLERLKHHPMVDAWKEADAIMDAAGDEAIGMALREGVDHMDEEAENREEQAEKVKEEREEKEKLLEKQKEKKEEAETLLEELSPGEFSDLTKSSEEIQKEVQDMLRKMNLLDEDLKGAAVDESL